MTTSAIQESKSTELKFTVPLIPPSVNHYKLPNGRGGWYRTKEAIAFIEAVVIFSRRQPVQGIPFFEVDITFELETRDFLRFDSDNFLKVACDALTIAGVIPDDRYIVAHNVRKRYAAGAQDVRTTYVVKGRGI